MYRGYFVPKVVDPTGRLSVSHRNPDCSNCGDGSITWTLLTEPKKRGFMRFKKFAFDFLDLNAIEMNLTVVSDLQRFILVKRAYLNGSWRKRQFEMTDGN